MLMNGTCEGCGQIILVEAPNGLEFEANAEATKKCGCPESKEILNRRRLKNNIARLCGEESKEDGFEPLSRTAIDVIIQAADLVYDYKIEKVQFVANETTITVKRTSEDHMVVDRKKTVQLEMSNFIGS